MTGYGLDDFLSEDELDTETMEEYLKNDDRDRRELVEDALESKGAKVFNDMRSLYSTLQMVNKNYLILVEKRDEFVDRGADYWMMKNDQEIQTFFREYMRRLHNYAASVHTLISHTYTFLDRYEDDSPELKSKYFNKISDRDLETKVKLLKQLRHYMQKNWVPPIGATISPAIQEGNEEKLELTLDKEEMMDWNGWDSSVHDFLESLDDTVEITSLAKEYQEELNDFYEWLRALIMSEFYQELLNSITAHLRLERLREDRS